MTSSNLRVLIDGTALPDEEARAVWQRFSDWMEEHRGDLGGFAKAEGFASVHPSVADGRPILVISRTAAQKPYRSVAADPSSGGSSARHDGHQPNRSSRRKSRK